MWFSYYGIPIYALVHVAAVTLFFVTTRRWFERTGIADRHAARLMIAYLLTNFVVARLLFDFLIEPGGPTLIDDPTPGNFLGGGFWGWQLVFFPLVIAYPFLCRLPRVQFLRAMALVLPPVIAVQKLACFASGCCSGTPSSLPWALVFPESSSCATPGIPIHPLQLYDMAAAVAIWGALHLLDRGARARPFLFPLFLGLYAAARFVTELLRHRTSDGTLLPSQWAEAVAAGLVVVLLVCGRKGWRRLVEINPEIAS